MKLRDYLISCDGPSFNGRVIQSGAEIKRIARKVGMHERSIYQIAEGMRRASIRAAARIASNTGGKVRQDEIREPG